MTTYEIRFTPRWQSAQIFTVQLEGVAQMELGMSWQFKAFGPRFFPTAEVVGQIIGHVTDDQDRRVLGGFSMKPLVAKVPTCTCLHSRTSCEKHLVNSSNY